MIRSIIATAMIIIAIVGMFTGMHPAWAIGAGLVAMTLIGWICVNKFEDEPQLGH